MRLESIRFRYVLGRSEGENCYHVWADPPSGSALHASDRSLVRIQFRPGGAVPDGTELTLQLQP